METDFSGNSEEENQCFYCENCDYKCSLLQHWKQHISTKKHKIHNFNNVDNSVNHSKQQKFHCPCGKYYRDRSGLWKHKQKCNVIIENNNANTNNLIQELVKETRELIKENQELKQMVIDISSKPTTITNNRNKFNLNFFLNDTCKDALNLTDFVSSIKLQLTDLENVGTHGYVNGISNIIIKNLNALDVNKRPVHCSDLKREIMYVKDENKWEKENNEKEKLQKAIKKVSYKNVLQISGWQKEHPGCEYSHNKKNDEYLQILNESMGAFTDEENAENINKIIKNVAKEVAIEKEIDV
jgi:hypothetical protein